MKDSTNRPTKPGVFDLGNGRKGIALDLSDLQGSMAIVKTLPPEGLIELLTTLHQQNDHITKLGKFVMSELLKRAADSVTSDETTDAPDADIDPPPPSATQPDLFAGVEPIVGGH